MLGGYGYCAEYRVEQFLRDAKLIEIGGGTIEAPIGRHRQDRTKMAVVVDGGRESRTHYRVLERFRAHTLCEVQLDTGRTHQIRAHCAALGCPLLGDPVYGQSAEGQRTMLHARALTVPREGKPPVTATAPLPDDFRALGFSDDDLGA